MEGRRGSQLWCLVNFVNLMLLKVPASRAGKFLFAYLSHRLMVLLVPMLTWNSLNLLQIYYRVVWFCLSGILQVEEMETQKSII